MSNFEQGILGSTAKEEKEVAFDSTMSLEEYMKVQKNEALSDPNMYFAGLELERKPSEEEAIMYYMQHGGPEDFAYRNLRHRSDIDEETKNKYYNKIS